jgi:hypothetical protein
MFVVARQGPTPGYIVDLYHRLPAIQKKLVDVDGSVYWMLSHPRQAATLIGDWFSGSLTLAHPRRGGAGGRSRRHGARRDSPLIAANRAGGDRPGHCGPGPQCHPVDVRCLSRRAALRRGIAIRATAPGRPWRMEDAL